MFRQPRFIGLLAAGLAAVLVGPSRAQVIIVDRRPNIPIARSYEVKEVSVDAKIRDQAAEVQVSQTFHNPGSFPLEAEFLFPLPDDGAISNLVLLADGQELTGKLLPRDEARKIYEDIVRSKRDPALLEYMGRGLYRTSVFPIPAGADRKVTMRYTQLLRRDAKVVEFSYPFGTQKFTARPIQRLELRARVESKEPIKSIYSPTDDATVKRIGEHEATIELVRRDVVPTADFRVLYTLDDGAVAASVLSYKPRESEDGYFLLLASPEFKAAESRPRPKTVVFVLDRSGSMSGKKIEQARESLKFCLNNLREDDTFNVIAYDDRVESFKPELQRYDRDRREEAIRFVDNIRPGGSTDINAALTTALGMLHDDGRPQYVLFLTDGLPTAGVTGEAAIAENAKKANKYKTRLFVFGVGFDVNARLLDRLSGGNSGTSEYVKPDENIETKVGRFYAKLTAPVLVGIQLELTGTDTNRIYPRDLPDLFEGGQLTLAGRYTRSGRTTVRLSGKVGDDRRTYEFPAELAETGRNASYDFVERIWAVRRVGEIIDQIDMNGKNKELTDELVELSKKYGILTPYTSFLADEGVRLHDRTANLGRAATGLESLHITTGPSGVAQRADKARYQQADRLGEAQAAVPPAAAGGGQMRGGVGGFGGMGGGLAAMAGRPGSAPIARDQEGKARVVDTVRNIDGKTFFLKEDRWIDSSVSPEEEKAATVLEQFSEPYFALARNQRGEQNRYLAFHQTVVVKIDGKVYRIEPPKKS